LIPVSSISVSQSLVSSREYGKDFPFKFAAVKQRAEVTFVLAHHPLHILSGDMFQFFRRLWASGGKKGCAGSLRSGLSHHSGIGGATDVRNLWPEPYYDTAWNAHVKDQLEERLHEMVCRGDVDLATAQQDISKDWIAAYRKYFHTDHPLLRKLRCISFRSAANGSSLFSSQRPAAVMGGYEKQVPHRAFRPIRNDIDFFFQLGFPSLVFLCGMKLDGY
jgi:hypothetical protein